jgi:hypothetical protein
MNQTQAQQFLQAMKARKMSASQTDTSTRTVYEIDVLERRIRKTKSSSLQRMA